MVKDEIAHWSEPVRQRLNELYESTRTRPYAAITLGFAIGCAARKRVELSLPLIERCAVLKSEKEADRLIEELERMSADQLRGVQ